MKTITIIFISLFHFSFTNTDENYSYKENILSIELLDTAKANKFYKKGLLSTKNKNYKEAFDYFTKAIEANPNFAEAYLKRAIIAYEAKMYEYIWKDFDMVIKLRPDYGEAYYERGRFKTQIDGKFPPTEGQKDFEKAKELGYKPF